MSSLEKKRKIQSLKPSSPSQESNPNPSLPYDLVVSCLARVSRLYYPNLSLVSKSFHSILTSPELYRTRTLLGRTETFLYVCLRFPDEANPRWFTLYRKPNQTLTNHTSNKKTKKKKDSSCCLLAPVRVINSPPVEGTGFIAVGCNIYKINAAIENSPCSNVWFLDCRTHTWLEAPRMRLTESNGRHDKLMYLAGSYEKPESLKCVEVYNTKTQTWKLSDKPMFKYRNWEGKIYSLLSSNVESPRHCVAFKPKDLTREMVQLDADLDGFSICVIENIIYSYIGKFAIVWKKSENKGAIWRRLMGLEGLPKFAHYSTVKLVNYRGKLVVLWDKYLPSSGYKEKMIWCAEISLEKRNGDQIWGKVEWLDPVLKVPKSYKILCSITATV